MANIKPIKIIPTKQSTEEDWKAFIDALSQRYGNKNARILFMKAWSKNGFSSTSSEFRKYLKGEYKIIISTTNIQATIDKIGGVDDFFSDVFTAGKWISIGFAVIIVGGVAMIIYNIAKNPAQAIGTTIKYAK